jgi:hypothetical protein
LLQCLRAAHTGKREKIGKLLPHYYEEMGEREKPNAGKWKAMGGKGKPTDRIITPIL